MLECHPAVENQDSVFMEGFIMLVLSRKCGEGIVIGNGITVTVVAVQGDRVKLGFKAPMEIPIHREEVHERMESVAPVLRYAECA
jgi:carbon storage regulator